jgi:hypothetical protein
MKQRKYHYTYRIQCLETNKFYIGVRSSNVKPEEDTEYLGSSKYFRPKNYVKEIIAEHDNRDSANLHEISLLRYWIDNPLNQNRHVPGKGFHMYGVQHSEETRKKLSAKKGEKHHLYNKKQSAERIAKRSQANTKLFLYNNKVYKGRENIMSEHNLTLGQVKHLIKKQIIKKEITI